MITTSEHVIPITKVEKIQTKKELDFLNNKAELFGNALIRTLNKERNDAERNDAELQQIKEMLNKILGNNERLEELTSTTLQNTDTIMATADDISTNVSTVLHEQRKSFSSVINAVTKLQNTYNQQLNCSKLQNVPRCILQFIQLLFQLFQLIVYLLYTIRPSNIAKTIGITNIPLIGTFLLCMAYLLNFAIIRLIAAYVLITIGVSKDDEEVEQQLGKVMHSTSFFITTGIIQICEHSGKFMFSSPLTIAKGVFQGIIDVPKVNETIVHLNEGFQKYTNDWHRNLTDTVAETMTEMFVNNTNSLVDNGKQLLWSYADFWKLVGLSSSAASSTVSSSVVGGSGDQIQPIQTQMDDLLTETGFLYEFCIIQLNQFLLVCSLPTNLIGKSGYKSLGPLKKSKRCRRCIRSFKSKSKKQKKTKTYRTTQGK
jgi:hypothetical protein